MLGKSLEVGFIEGGLVEDIESEEDGEKDTEGRCVGDEVEGGVNEEFVVVVIDGGSESLA